MFIRHLFPLVAVALASIMPAAAVGEVPSAPILRLEAGTHTGAINRVDADASGRLLVTGSYDKTARIWDSRSGTLLHTLRVPVADGNEGMLFAVAISPDGRTAVAGGWTLLGGDGASLYVFDTTSGALRRRVGGLADAIFDLEFSPDGRLLAVGMANRNGVTVLDTATWTPRAHLGGYEDRVMNVAWSAQGRLAVAAYDGRVRLYDAGLREIATVRTSAGTRPFDVAFSPDGGRLAAGFEDSSTLEVFDGRDLRSLYRVTSSDLEAHQTLGSVTWSADGNRLIAGGRAQAVFDNVWSQFARVWEDGGRGRHFDVPAVRDTFLDMKTLPDGRIIVVGAGQDMTMFTPGMRSEWRVSRVTESFLSFDLGHLKVSFDGREVGAQAPNRRPFTLDIDARRVFDQESFQPSARSSVAGMTFTDFAHRGDAKLNGQPIGSLQNLESVHGAAVAPDGRVGIIGTAWNVHAIEADGRLRWRVASMGTASPVNISGDGRLAVTAHGDGTLRWNRISDGTEVLAFFRHADGERWVMWTPSGYYDASPGGEDLIGWHVNRGIDSAPDFFPAATFRDRYYRPDIVQRILASLDEQTAISEANAERRQSGPAGSVGAALPPVVRILSPAPMTELAQRQISLELAISVPDDAPLDSLEVRVNGRPQPGARGLGREAGSAAQAAVAAPDGAILRTVPLDLSQVQGEEAIVTVQGVNRHGYGPPAELVLRLAGDAFRPFDTAPKLYVLAVGVSSYVDASLNLLYAAKDAADMADLLATQEGGLYREVEIRLLRDEDATREAIRDALFWLEEEVTANDVAKIFIAGHGINDNTGELYFTPHDVNVDALRRTGLAASEIVRTISYLQGRVIYFMDACHSGNLEVVRRSVGGVDLNRHIQDLSAAETGAVVFSSAAGSQFALESPAWGNGAFTLAVLEGLRGKADFNGDGAVSMNELNLYVSERVKELTQNQQTPVLQRPGSIRDFPLAVVAR